MADIKDLRNRANNTRNRMLSRRETVCNAVNNIINSDASFLTMMAHDEADANAEQFAEKLVTKITEGLANPVNGFMDYMKSQGVDDRKIRAIVTNICATFGLTGPDEPYDVQLMKAAEYLEANPMLYDDVVRMR